MTGLRMFRRSPGFTAIAVATLGLGIGAGTAVFSIVDAVFLRPLPYRDPGRLLAVWKASNRDNRLSKLFVAYGDFEQWRKSARTVESMSAATWAAGSRVWRGPRGTRQLLAAPVSAEFFDTLGVRAERGRTFTRADEAAGCSVVLAHDFWRSEMGGDPGVLGKTVVLDERNCAVLGVMPASFVFYPPVTKMWMLIDSGFEREHLIVGVFARLKPGVSREQAQQELSAMHAAIHAGDARELELGPVAYALRGEFTWLASRDLPRTLMVLGGAVLALLLIACVNVANLLAARWALRHKELTIRAALGAGRRRIAQQVLGEGLWLAGMATALGCAIAYAAVRYFQASNAVQMPVGAAIAIRWPVLAFAVLLCGSATLITALAPALHASRVDLVTGMKPLRMRWPQFLIAIEMAASVVLLWGAGLLMQSVLRMEDADLGFDPRGVVTGSVSLPRAHFSNAAARAQVWQRFAERAGVGLSSRVPPYGGGTEIMEIPGRQSPERGPRDTGDVAVDGSYFRVMRVPLLRGRYFDARDAADDAPAAIVNSALVQEYFAGADPLGQHIRLWNGREATPWLTIVGVVGNEKRWPLLQEMNWVANAEVFRPVAQDPRQSMNFVARGGGDLRAAVQSAVAAVDAGIPLPDVESMEQRLATPLAYPRFRAAVLAAFSGCALLLAAVGLYGVLAQLVARRTREIGVRRAVGAQTRDLVLLVAKSGGVPVAIGLAIGMGSTLGAGRLVRSLLYGLKPDDPATLATIPIVLLAVAAIAMAAPARRASRVDPMTALRED